MEETPLKIEEIVPTIERVKNTIVFMENNLKNIQAELNEKEVALKDREEKLNQAKLERQQLEFDYIGLETEFKKVSELFSELSGQQESSVSIKELLGIYIALLEKVFSGKPHAKILYLLHGDKAEMTRDELTKATGFSAAIVRHSISELNRADLIKLDEEEGIARLVNRIYE
jgi:DNA-binding transcriptional ArsR family regulator